MRLVTYLLIALTALLVVGLTSKDHIEQLQDQLARWNEIFPREKIYIHTDRPYYMRGDTIWYKAYLVNGRTLKPDTLSQVVYIELINPDNEVVARRNQFIFAGGSAGEIGIPLTGWPAGQYQLRAYTRFMANLDFRDQYARELFIIDDAFVEEISDEANRATAAGELPDVQLLPESGHLVDGLRSMVGVKAINRKTGLGVDVEGVVRDQEGNQITTFKTFFMGLGQFTFLPLAHEKYEVEIRYGEKVFSIPFPEVKSKGYLLQVKSRKNKIYIKSKTNIPSGLAEAYVVCQMQSQLVAYADISKVKAESTISIPKEPLAAGVMQVTLFAAGMQPVAERLVFIKGKPDGLAVDFRMDETIYAPREKVVLEILVSDSLIKKGLESNLSLSVTDRGIVSEVEGDENIWTYLLLNSDLRGKIERPGYYFENDDPSRKLALDVLMLTQGWRQYDWEEIIEGRPPRRKHPMERGITIEGYVSQYKKPDKPVQSYVTFSSFDGNLMVEEKMTGPKGKFQFTDLIFFDSTEYYIQARIPTKRSRRKKDPMSGKKWNSIHILPFVNEKINRNTASVFPFSEPDKTNSFLNTYAVQSQLNEEFAMSIQLEEVVIKKSRLEEDDPYTRPGQLYGTPSDRIIPDSIYSSLSFMSPFQLIRQFVPGVRIYGTFPNEIAVIRGFSSINASSEALYVLDGVPTDAQIISSTPISDISHIDVLKGPAAAIYGSRSSGGVILVYTKRGAGRVRAEKSPGIEYFVHPGPHIGKKYYTPQYDGEGPFPAPGMDQRKTLYWESFLFTDSLGQARVEFFTCDRHTAYAVDLQGISADGRPVVARHVFEVSKED